MATHPLAAAIRPQFLASIDALIHGIESCPDCLWANESRHPPYWRLAFHTLFWLDLYLYGAVEGFVPPEPYGLEELEWDDRPPRVYTREEMRTYALHGRDRCVVALDGLTEKRANRECAFGWGTVPYAELLLYNMRHVQHGVGQMNLILRQMEGVGSRWVARAE
ncbi:MAG: DinB family protein [Planctomycetota bacterium]|jgi:hypothetical protein